jgi:hypothetical protein
MEHYCDNCQRYTRETPNGLFNSCQECGCLYEFRTECDCGDTGIVLTDDIMVESFQGEEFILEGQMVPCPDCPAGQEMKEFLD